MPEGVRGVKVVDITHSDSVRGALAGVDTIVHLAARAHHLGRTDAAVSAEYERVNCLGTKTLLEEAVRASAGRIVFVSSVKALGNRSEKPFTEADDPHPEDPYGVTKRHAEVMLEETASSGALDVTIVRLPAVYGPGMQANMLRLFGAVNKRLVLPLAGVKNHRSFVYVGNAVAALHTLVLAPTGGFRLFHVTDGTDLSTPELVRAIGNAMGKPVRLIHFPDWLLRSLGGVGDVLGSASPIPGSDGLTQLLGSLQLDSSRISRELGFSPPYSVEEGLKNTADWFISRQTGMN